MKTFRLTLNCLGFLTACLLAGTTVQNALSLDAEPPAWFTETPSDPEYYYGVGTSPESMTDAEADARAALILNIAATVHTEVKNYLRERGAGADEQVDNIYESQSRSTATQEALPNLEIHKRQSGHINYALARLSREKFRQHIETRRKEVHDIVEDADEWMTTDDVVIALKEYTKALTLAESLRFVSPEASEKPDAGSLAREIQKKLTNLQTEIRIEMLSGNSQHGMYGKSLAEALVVQVSYKGTPLPKFPLKATYRWGTGRLKSRKEAADASVDLYTDTEGKGVCWVNAIRAISAKNHIRITADANSIQLPTAKAVDFHYTSAFSPEHKTGGPQITQNGDYGEPIFQDGQEIALEIRVPETGYIHLFSLLPDGNFDYHESLPIEQAYQGKGFSIQFIAPQWRLRLEKVPVTGERGIGLETLLVVTTPIAWEPAREAATAKYLIEQLDTSVGKGRWRAGTASSRVLPKENPRF